MGTMQPPKVLFADAELWATGYLRSWLNTRFEEYAQGVRVGNQKAVESTSPYPERQVVVRRDGGPQEGLFDLARLTVRVWASTEQGCADLARLARAAFVMAAGDGPCVRVTSPTGPQAVADERGPMKFFVIEAKLRGEDI